MNATTPTTRGNGAAKPPPPQPPRFVHAWQAVQAVLRRCASAGKRLPFGLREVDAALRGGLPMGRLVTVGGAPGCGKTGLAIHCAVRWGASFPTLLMTADEPADHVLVRIGQCLGFDRDTLDARNPASLEALANAMRERAPQLVVLDLADDENDLATTIDRWTDEHDTGTVVLDSIHAAALLVPSDSRRNAVDEVVGQLRAARDAGHAVLAVQELAREAYQGGSRPRRATIASGKESGGLEYGVDVQITLARGRGSDRIAVAFDKNRLGKCEAFDLRFDEAAGTLHDADPGDVDASQSADVARADAAVLAVLREADAPMTTTAIRETSGIGVSAAAVTSALTRLAAAAAIVATPGPRRSVLYAIRPKKRGNSE